MPTLADILRGIDSVVTPGKRRLVDLMRNPLDYTAQAFGQVGDSIAQFGNNAVLAQQGQDLTRMGSVMGEAPQYRGALSSTINGLLGVAPIGATVYHGSPHKFNKFDASKIGTGEGAQAYGHGLYLADAQDVAKGYQQRLTEYRAALDDVPIDPLRAGKRNLMEQFPKIPEKDAEALNAIITGIYSDPTKGGVAGARQTAKDMLDFYSRNLNKVPPELQTVAQARIAAQKEKVRLFDSYGERLADATGNLYKVDLPDEHIAKMLDWDKPLSGQPESVRKFFEPRVAPIRENMAKPAPGWGDLSGPQKYDPTGSELLALLRNRDANMTPNTFLGNGLGPDISASLRQQGIPGIRYLDGVSRGAGAGTSNYVVFPGNEGLLKILERNGEPIK
jgi:hypothetical protein